MEVEDNKQLTFTELANAIRPNDRGPIDKTIIENRLGGIKQSLHQYYEGNSRVIGSPYKPTGYKNPQFASPSLISNAVFYEHSPNLGLSKQEMYKTTSNMFHSNSYDRLQTLKCTKPYENPNPLRVVRKNNTNIKNMTTLDIDIGQNINTLYKHSLSARSMSALPER